VPETADFYPISTLVRATILQSGHDLAQADTQLEQAGERLQRTRQHTASSVALHDQAKARVEVADNELYRHDQRARIRRTFDQLPHLRQHVDALDTWGRWAHGNNVDLQRVGDIATTLTGCSRWDPRVDQYRTLGQAIHDWAEHTHIELPTPAGHDRTRQQAGLEFGL
jgi:hypothetical protein